MLRRHFPEAAIYGDIRELTRDKLIADIESKRISPNFDKWSIYQQKRYAIRQICNTDNRTGVMSSADTDRRRHVHGEPEKHTAEADEQAQREPVASDKPSSLHIDLLTGGFPCQPFSQAGKRKGTADNRYLWPEMLRVIQDFKPTWIIAENVRGLLTMQQGVVFENICLDLEASGYEVQAFIIPACAVNAPHRRDRVWIVANTNDSGRKSQSLSCPISSEGRNNIDIKQSDSDDTNASSERCDNRSDNRQERHVQTNIWSAEEDRGWGTRTREGIQSSIEKPEGQESINTCGQGNWSENWLETATRLCGMDDGLSRGLVRLPDGTTISRSKWRQEALKAYGNAIVPQVAIEIMNAIKRTEQPPQAAEKNG